MTREYISPDTENFNLTALSNDAVSIYFENAPSNVTGHPGSRTTFYIQSGNTVTNTSISGSTTKRNNRWPDARAHRLQADAHTEKIAVLNRGIGGNAVVSGGLCPTALSRFERHTES
ncbi:MAG: hypothetical protein JXJ04_10550 [Spirochaetales bacterium]|nr:hypothetical protein [Spirochaetales bacterium]